MADSPNVGNTKEKDSKSGPDQLEPSIFSRKWWIGVFDFIVKISAAIAVVTTAITAAAQFIDWKKVRAAILPNDSGLSVRECTYTFFNDELKHEDLPGSDPDANPFIALRSADHPQSDSSFDTSESCKAVPDGTFAVSIASTIVCGGIGNIWFDDKKDRIYIPMVDRTCRAHRSTIEVLFFLK